MLKTGIKNYTLLGIMYMLLLPGLTVFYLQINLPNGNSNNLIVCTYEKYILTIKNYQSEIDYINSLYGLTGGSSLSGMPQTHNQTDLTNRVIKIDCETEKFLKNLDKLNIKKSLSY